jgi:hypothetical protein
MAAQETITLREAVIQFLKSKPDEEFKPRELAKELKAAFPAKFEHKKEIQLAAEITSGATKCLKQYPQFLASEDTPRKYWWKTESACDSAAIISATEAENWHSGAERAGFVSSISKISDLQASQNLSQTNR